MLAGSFLLSLFVGREAVVYLFFMQIVRIFVAYKENQLFNINLLIKNEETEQNFCHRFGCDFGNELPDSKRLTMFNRSSKL